MNNTFESNAVHSASSVSRAHTSVVLRSILTKNPSVQKFSVARILATIGNEQIEASLMMFSIPGIVPVTSPRGIVSVPTGAIAGQMIAGKKRIHLPRFILRKQVTRRALAVAIHAVLPVLEAAEKLVRPRWSWVSHSISRRAIGLLVFLLAVAIAYPFSGFSALHSVSIFAISLGMAEGDGLAVVIGVVGGLLSLAVLAVTGVSVRALRDKVVSALRKVARKLGLHALADFLERLGYTQLARVLRFQWSDALLMWDPERTADGGHGAQVVTPPAPRATQVLDSGVSAVQASPVPLAR